MTDSSTPQYFYFLKWITLISPVSSYGDYFSFIAQSGDMILPHSRVGPLGNKYTVPKNKATLNLKKNGSPFLLLNKLK